MVQCIRTTKCFLSKVRWSNRGDFYNRYILVLLSRERYWTRITRHGYDGCGCFDVLFRLLMGGGAIRYQNKSMVWTWQLQRPGLNARASDVVIGGM